MIDGVYNVENIGAVSGAQTVNIVDNTAQHNMTLAGNTTLTLNNSGVSPSNLYLTRILKITMPSTLYSITLPNSIRWFNTEPFFNVPNHTVYIELKSNDGGNNWKGSWLSEAEV